jgi:hypothetical protein
MTRSDMKELYKKNEWHYIHAGHFLSVMTVGRPPSIFFLLHTKWKAAVNMRQAVFFHTPTEWRHHKRQETRGKWLSNQNSVINNFVSFSNII